MKKIFTMAVLAAMVSAVGLTACGDKKQKTWDMGAMISLRAATMPQSAAISKANPVHLTPLEIVQQVNAIAFYNRKINGDNVISRGFADAQRDYITPKLMMWGTDIIMNGTDYYPLFIEGEDMVLCRGIEYNEDTVAYVPNKVLRTAQPLIKAAFESGDYETCYKLFDEAFIFIPITGEEWRELKRQNKN